MGRRYGYWSDASVLPQLVAGFAGAAPDLPDEYTATLYVEPGNGAALTIARAGPRSGFRRGVAALLNALPPSDDGRATVQEFASFGEMMFGSNYRAEYLLDASAVRSSLKFKATSVMIGDGVVGPTCVDALLDGRSVSPGTWFMMDVYGGAIASVSPAATAFVHRWPRLINVQLYTSWANDNDAAARRATISRWRASVARCAAPTSSSAYQNYIDRSVPLEAYYGDEGLRRLRAVKRRLDPGNVWQFAMGVPAIL